MCNKVEIDVRADYFKNGNIIPISYVDEYGRSHYIKSISRVVVSDISKNMLTYFCREYDGIKEIAFVDGKWFLVKN